MYDTIIVGAGVVGSYLARRLSWLGYRVLVLEGKAAAGQNVCCTGIVSRQCLDLLAPEDSIILRGASSAEFVAPSGKQLRLSREDEVAYIIDRPALDLMLARRAQSCGACYLFHTLVTDIQVAKGCVSVTADYEGEQRLFEAETAVIAAGFGSMLPDKLKLGKISDFVFGAQAEVDVGNLSVVRIYLDRNLAPGGFAWLVPTREGKGLAGLITHCQPEQHLGKLLSTLKAEGVITSTRVVSSYAPIPLGPLPSSYADRVLVVGEAAGQVKPITGGGIYYGLLCAAMAVDSLHQAFLARDFSKQRLSWYQKRWRSRLGRELKVGYWLHHLYTKLDNQQIEFLHSLMSKNDVAHFIAELKGFSFDWHSELMLKVLKYLAVAVPRQLMKSSAKQSVAAS